LSSRNRVSRKVENLKENRKGRKREMKNKRKKTDRE
jgi:hypothetical protein